MRRIITLTLLSLLLGAATAATDAVEQKAARHYRAGEWANAAAMYGLLIDRHPQRTDCYARAITSAAMCRSTRSSSPWDARALPWATPASMSAF